MLEIEVRYLEEGNEAEMLHSGPPHFSIGQAVEILDVETGKIACSLYVDDVDYDPELHITFYHCGPEKFSESDLKDLYDEVK